jgi:hypothetical protein
VVIEGWCSRVGVALRPSDMRGSELEFTEALSCGGSGRDNDVGPAFS